MKIQNTFLGGRMNKDIDERLLQNGEYRHAENIKVSTSEDSDAGAVENVLGNKVLTALSLGSNPEAIGVYADSFSNKVYWFVVSDTGSYVCEYNFNTDTPAIILEDTRVSPNNVLNFSKDYLITGVNIVIDNDNDNVLLLWTDNLNPPRIINIERAKTYTASTFLDEDISVIKVPPLNPPSIVLSNTASKDENNLEERFLRFAYRYEYLDGEKSALSSFTETAFKPKSFQYDYATSSNESMINSFNLVNISFNTGGPNVKSVELVYKESGSNGVYVVENFNKVNEGWADNTIQTFDFDNNKLYKVLPETQLYRLYDAVPLLAKAQELIGNRIVYGNYTSDYDIKDCNGDDINIDFSLSKVSTPITEGTPTESLKSLRDYEVVQVYMDDKGRMTTGLSSKNNTIYIPNEDCVNKNQIKVTIPHKAPCFAKKFRFFIKQSKYDYDTVVPTLFYRDGLFAWIKLEGDDINKVKEGDFLYVKSDTKEVLDGTIQTKILDIVDQPINFLEDDPSIEETKQQSGKYFKVKPKGYRMNEEDFVNYIFQSYDSSSNLNDNPIGTKFDVIEPAVYYGNDPANNDLTSSGVYSHNVDIRYLIEIDGVGTPDTFRWSDDDGSTWTELVPITGAAQVLSHGVEVTFGATTGHDLTDNWVVSAKADNDDGFGGSESSKAYAFFKSLPSNTRVNQDDVIEGGARISITYDEYGEFTELVDKSYTSSSQYANLEEWFFKEDIISDLGIPIDRIWFRRGFILPVSNSEASYFSQDNTGDMCMIILSNGTQNNDLDARVKVRSTLNIFQSEQNIILETKEKYDSTDIFYEIGRTYDIDALGNHLAYNGSDISQSFGVTDGEFLLPVFNCFAWGNGFESYKIKDSFNATSFKIDTRPTGILENYRRSKRIASLTYSDVYEQTTNYNGLNEFNLAVAPYKDMDDKFGSIQKLYSKDTDLTVYQEDKVHKVLYQKDVLYDADGQGNIRESNKVLGQEVAYAGEFGISKNPESHAVYGNSEWFTDAKRGILLRKSQAGLEPISRYGMEDWFKDALRGQPTGHIGCYDTYDGRYMLYIPSYDVVVFDEDAKGFTTFFKFVPEMMVSLNNDFYSLKGGQLYIHNSDEVNHNTFYGIQSPSKVTIIVNESPSEIKELQALSLEGSDAWNALISAYVTTAGDEIQSSIASVEFIKKEGLWYAYARRNENQDHLDSKSTYGIGEIKSVGVTNIIVKGVSSLLTAGDTILKDDLTVLGQVISSSVQNGETTIELTGLGTATVDDFVFGRKDARVEGGNLRGYAMRMELDITKDTKVELFAVNSEGIKSYS